MIIGFLVGVVAKHAVKIGIAIAILVMVLIVAGILAPSQVIQPFLTLIQSGAELESKVSDVAGYLPYSSVTFVVGLAIGFLKG